MFSDIEEELRRTTKVLSRGEFELLEHDGRIGRLTVEGLKNCITEYGRTLVDLPENAMEYADIYEIVGKTDMWSVDLPLWTKEEGLSDLTLIATITRNKENILQLKIDDIRVL